MTENKYSKILVLGAGPVVIGSPLNMIIRLYLFAER